MVNSCKAQVLGALMFAMMDCLKSYYFSHVGLINQAPEYQLL